MRQGQEAKPEPDTAHRRAGVLAKPPMPVRLSDHQQKELEPSQASGSHRTHQSKAKSVDLAMPLPASLPLPHPALPHYLEVLPVIVVDHGQKDGHEDVRVDDDVGNEVQ